MKRHVYDKTGFTPLRIEEAEPVCGEDFCDTCGDCLYCYGGELSCYENSWHWWVVYEDATGGGDA